MAVCNCCNQDMSHSDSCTSNLYEIDGKSYTPIKYGDEGNGWPDQERCNDCNVIKGGYHHPGCDTEKCAKCSGRILSCGCLENDNKLESLFEEDK